MGRIGFTSRDATPPASHGGGRSAARQPSPESRGDSRRAHAVGAVVWLCGCTRLARPTSGRAEGETETAVRRVWISMIECTVGDLRRNTSREGNARTPAVEPENAMFTLGARGLIQTHRAQTSSQSLPTSVSRTGCGATVGAGRGRTSPAELTGPTPVVFRTCNCRIFPASASSMSHLEIIPERYSDHPVSVLDPKEIVIASNDGSAQAAGKSSRSRR